ncbi:pentapeptide repeat-containing protein [Vibrio sp. S4M6]|uniref:DUF2169 family type VI secretion system accessory protein n=1 Tax=Vibrio sinus TaxID=2946865 RepID=UPI00202A0463|nr:DUF2169 domain-containing protein [Vibrio sinus]MCL9782506.1 pentapeptide repeat-containing protein [Vibrio sinus]
MRAIKSLNQGILTHTFVIAGKPRQAITAIYGFDLADPNKRLTEQELWQRSMGLLGEVPLDMGMLKQQGEWLVCGSAYAGESARTAVRVSAQVGEQHKSLDVLGQRYWQQSKYGLSLSHPEPFLRMPLNWNYAVRGDGLEMNPSGIAPPAKAQSADGLLHAGIYYPGESQSEWSAKPRPAGFMPIDVMQPKRQKLMGTYDEHWQNTAWPHFPSDFNPLFYNVAPEDQRIQGYFQGGEPYALVNLHPEFVTIQGTIPYFQPRAFLRRTVEQHFVVSEVALTCDTFWMFPETSTGILLFHGSAPVDDEEGLDVQEVLLSEEPYGSRPKSIEYYAELFDRAQTTEYIAEQIGIDMSPLEEAKADISKAEKLMEDAPKYMQFRMKQVSGSIPTPQSSMAKSNEMMMNQLDDRIASLAEMEKSLEKNPVNPEVKASVAKGQKELAGVKQKLADNIQSLSEVKTKVANVKDKLPQVPQQAMGQKLAMEDDLSKLGRQFELKHTWQDQASSLVYLANQYLTLNKFEQQKQQLEALGFRELYFQMYLLGWLPEAVEFVPEHWALEPSDEVTSIGPGWVFMQHQEGEIKSITIRPDDLYTAGEDYLVPGSEPLGWHSGIEAPAQLIVTDLVSSWLLAQALADYVDIVYLAQVDDLVEPEVEAKLIESKYVYLACASNTNLDEWRARFEQLQPLYYPRDIEIIQFHQQDIEPLEWINENLSPDLYKHLCHHQAMKLEAREKDVAPKQIFSQMKNHVDKKAVDAFGFNPLEHEDPVGYKMDQALDNFANHMKTQRNSDSYGKYIDQVKSQFAESKAKFKQKPTLDTDDKAELQKRFTDIKAQLKKASDRNDVPVEKAISKDEFDKFEEKMMSMMTELEPLKEKAKDLVGKLDTEEERDYQELTREQVILRYASGLSFEKRNLSELDLSGIDLSGANFTEAILSKTNLSRCNLSNCQFKDAVANEADFTEANVSQANFEHAILTKTSFVKSSGQHANFSHATMVESNLAQADLSESVWTSTMANQVCLVQANLHLAQLSHGVFIEADLTGANITQARLSQAVFNDAAMHNSDLRQSKGSNTIFWGIKGQSTQWDHCELNGVRFGPADLTQAKGRFADFSNCCVKDAVMEHADFRGSNFNRSYMDSIQAHYAKFDGANFNRSQLTRCDFQSASLKAVNGMRATLFRSKFQHANLWLGNFYNADFRKMELGNTNTQDMNVDATILSHKLELYDEQK